MAKTENYNAGAVRGGKIKKEVKRGNIKLSVAKRTSQQVFLCCAAFFMGKISFFNALNPIGIAFASVYADKGALFYVLSLFTFLGYIAGETRFSIYQYAASMVVLIAVAFWRESRNKPVDEYKKAALGAVSILAGGILLSIMNGFSTFIFLRSVVEAVAVFALSVLINRSAETLSNGIKNRILSDDEAVSTALIGVFIIAALSKSTFLGMPLKMFLSVFFILSVSYRGGAAVGGASGAILGFVLIMCGAADYAFLCVMSFAGVICGMTGRKSKISAVLGFAVSAAVPAFYMGMKQDISGAVMSVAGAFLFLFMPNRILKSITTFSTAEEEFDTNEYFIRVKEYTEEKLDMLSNSFKTMAEVFRMQKKENKILPEGTDKIVDLSAERVCKECGLAIYCWKAKTLETYGAFYAMINEFEETGGVKGDRITGNFPKSCVKFKSLKQAVESCCREAKTSQVWQMRMEESADVINEQLKAMSAIILSVKKNIDIRPVYNESIAKEIKKRIEKAGFQVEKATVNTDRSENITVHITGENCCNKDRCAVNFAREISLAVGKDMEVRERNCGKNCSCTFAEKSIYGCTSAFMAVAADGSEESGDSFEALQYRSGVYTAAVSDGMGTGNKAAEESKRTIKNLAMLLKSGFNEETAVKILNCAMAGRNGEMFATLDVFSADLKKGRGKVIKNGGSSVFVIRDKKVTEIKSTTLPLGIKAECNSDITTFAMADKDIVLMVTDGVSDSLGGEKAAEKIEKIAERINMADINSICTEVIKQGMAAQGGKAGDDMLVGAVKIYEV